jgi:hypothetical protein
LSDLNLQKVILLDNQSTVSLFCDKSLVSNIRDSEEPLTLQSNEGSMKVHQIADIGRGQSPVWFSKRAITNILSLKEVVKTYRVIYNSSDSAFFVLCEDVGLPNMIFKMHSSGLHYYNPSRKEFSFVVTVEDTMAPFNKRQILGADKARTFNACIAFPSLPDYKWILRSGQVDECPVSMEDAEIAQKIWGPSIASLKGKTVCTKAVPVKTDIVQVPVKIRDLHQEVTLTIDVFFVNKIPFLITLSGKITFTTVTHLSNRKIDTIFKAFKTIFKYYLERGFQVMTVTADGEFSPLDELLYELPGAPRLNLTATNEHEPYVERCIHVIKERVRAVRHSLPFTSLPMQVTTHMVFFVVKLLNYFPAKGGVSMEYSPKTIMSGERINCKHYCVPFGTYCQVHAEDGPRNSMVARTQGAISLGPSKNRQGGQLFFTLTTAKVVVRHSWNIIPMPTAVIARVNALAADQPSLLTFYDRAGREIGDSDADAQQTGEPQYETPGVVADDAKITGVDSKEDPESDPSNDYDPDITPTLPDEPPLIYSTPIPASGFVDESTPESFEPTVEHKPTATEPVPSPAVSEPTPVAPTDQPVTDTRRRSTRERKQVSSTEHVRQVLSILRDSIGAAAARVRPESGRIDNDAAVTESSPQDVGKRRGGSSRVRNEAVALEELIQTSAIPRA